MRSYVALFTVGLFTASTAFSQKVGLNFAFNTRGSRGECGRAIITDLDGASTVLGSFNSAIYPDPASSTSTLNPIGSGTDIFVAQYEKDGRYRRAFSIGTNDNNTDLFGDVAVDQAKNIFITGSFRGTVDFDPGAGIATLSVAGDSFDRDGFVAKYDSSGVFQWAFKLGSTYESDGGRSLTVDKTGNVYVTGLFTDTVDFDPGPGTKPLSSSGQRDIFVAKYNSMGAYIWAFKVGGYSFDTGKSIRLDEAGNVLLTGEFNDRVDFDPGPATSILTSNGQEDFFIAKYTPTGTYIRAFSIGGTDGDSGFSITSDANNNIFVTGSFKGVVDFDPSVSIASLTTSESVINAGFIAKYDLSGNYQWAFKMEGDKNGYSEATGNSAKANKVGYVSVTGSFTKKINFGSINGPSSLLAIGGRDAFIITYAPNGAIDTRFSIGSSGNDEGNAVALESSGNILTTGYFNANANFNPTAPAVFLTPVLQDCFVASYSSFYCESIRSGSWEDPAIWSCQRTPTANDQIKIKSGHTVTISGSIANARQIIYEGGTILFGTPNSQLILSVE